MSTIILICRPKHITKMKMSPEDIRAIGERYLAQKRAKELAELGGEQRIPSNIGKTAELLGVCTKTLRRWDKQGILKAIRINRQRRYRAEDIERFAANKQQEDKE